MRLLVVTLGIVSLAAALTSACSRSPKGATVAPAGATDILPGTPDCYKMAGATTCPKDPSDPSGLPKVGAVCTLPVCKVCGSGQVPAYRDANGVPQTGWCICVEKSDDSGVRIYSCGQRTWGAKD